MIFKTKNKQGSIAITMVMIVFCLLMSVSMSYHKMIQTEEMVQSYGDDSDRAADAAFSGINYAMSTIQANKKVFTANTKVMFVSRPTSSPSGIEQILSQWIYLNKNMTFSTYKDSNGSFPPYRFKIGIGSSNCYNTDNTIVYIKSIGEYIRYEENDITKSTATFTAEILAECEINKVSKTLKLKKYKKLNPDEKRIFSFSGNYNSEN